MAMCSQVGRSSLACSHIATDEVHKHLPSPSTPPSGREMSPRGEDAPGLDAPAPARPPPATPPPRNKHGGLPPFPGRASLSLSAGLGAGAGPAGARFAPRGTWAAALTTKQPPQVVNPDYAMAAAP